MDAFAALQLKKRKAAQELSARQKVAEEMTLEQKMSTEEKLELNRLIGIVDPPQQVFAVGKDGCAGVWWIYPQQIRDAMVMKTVDSRLVADSGTKEDGEKVSVFAQPREDYVITTDNRILYEILGWEVHRYRRDRTASAFSHKQIQKRDIFVTEGSSESSGKEPFDRYEWLYKGFTFYESISTSRLQILHESLTNNHEYRFTVVAVTTKGKSCPSKPSNSVMVESPLPSGWFRFLDKKRQRHYYANIRSGISRWSRPEFDPYFLDEGIRALFEDREIDHLLKLFQEDMHHYQCITVGQFLDALREIGERCTKRWVTKLFKGYAGDDEKLLTWQNYMEVVAHIKRYRIQSAAFLTKPFELFSRFFTRAKVRTVLKPKRNKLGSW